MHVKCFAFAQKWSPSFAHTLLIDTGLQLAFERQLKYRMGWRCCVNYYPFPPKYVFFVLFPFFECRILHNIIVLLLSSPQLTRYMTKRQRHIKNEEGFHHMLIYFCRRCPENVGEMEFDILAFFVLAQTGGICKFLVLLTFLALIWI